MFVLNLVMAKVYRLTLFPPPWHILHVQCTPETNISVFYINVVASQ